VTLSRRYDRSAYINAKAVFLPVESIWPWDGSQGLTTGQNAREHGRKGSVFSGSPLKHWWGPLAHNLGPHHQPSHLAWD